MKRLICIGLFVTLCGFAEATDAPQMLQVKQSFEPTTLTASSNTTIDFVNMDDVNHDIQITDPKSSKTDLGVEHVGDTVHYSFAASGIYTITCGIHPRMKAKIIVQ